uniref:C2H2-type domain-containing protein n=1 Tax=Hippocampus comes TaxID=109280 RepID=A0A3Q2Z5V8_HIPCM
MQRLSEISPPAPHRKAAVDPPLHRKRRVITATALSHTVATNTIPLFCSECGKAFGDRGILNRHMKRHTGEKPFACSACGKAFSRRDSHLTRHARTHTGEKRFICSLCDKRFTTKGNVLLHMRTHTGENKRYLYF